MWQELLALWHGRGSSCRTQMAQYQYAQTRWHCRFCANRGGQGRRIVSESYPNSMSKRSLSWSKDLIVNVSLAISVVCRHEGIELCHEVSHEASHVYALRASRTSGSLIHLLWSRLAQRLANAYLTQPTGPQHTRRSHRRLVLSVKIVEAWSKT